GSGRLPAFRRNSFVRDRAESRGPELFAAVCSRAGRDGEHGGVRGQRDAPVGRGIVTRPGMPGPVNDPLKAKLPPFGPISPLNPSITVTERQAAAGGGCHIRYPFARVVRVFWRV